MKALFTLTNRFYYELIKSFQSSDKSNLLGTCDSEHLKKNLRKSQSSNDLFESFIFYISIIFGIEGQLSLL